jgi:LAS superfamily LD-carboxypeptidase LdcB
MLESYNPMAEIAQQNTSVPEVKKADVEAEKMKDFLGASREKPVPIESPAFSDKMVANKENRHKVEIDSDHELADERLVSLVDKGIKADEKEGEAVLRESVANKLVEVNEQLKKAGLEIFVRSGWRSLEEQQKRKDDWIAGEISSGRSEESVCNEADSRFSDAEPTAPHLSGGAFDLEIYDEKQEPIPTKPWHKDKEGKKIMPDLPDLLENGDQAEVLRALVGHTIGYREGEEYVKDPEAHFNDEKNKANYLKKVAQELEKVADKNPDRLKKIAQTMVGDTGEIADKKALADAIVDSLSKNWDQTVQDMPEVTDKQYRDEQVLKMVKNRRLIYHIMTELAEATAHPREFWHFGFGDRTSAYFSGEGTKAYYDIVTGEMKDKQQQELRH